MKLSEKIDHNIWVTVDGELLQLRPLVDQVEVENAALKRENERHVDVFERIVNWSKAYPIDVFPEPDLKKAHKILKANGMTLDAISASAMRHVVTEVGKMAKDALLTAEEQEDE